MCDVKIYYQMYDYTKDMLPEETLPLITEAKDENEQLFYKMLGDYLLQTRQKKLIEDNVF